MNTALLLGTIAGLSMGAPAAAQDDTEASIHQIEAPLRGPEVKDERAPGVDPRFSAGMERSRESERPIPLRVYEQELRALGGKDVGDELRLSESQEKAIREALSEHRRATRAYYQEHRAAFAAIRGEGGAAPGMSRRTGTRDAAASRQRPNAGDGQDEIAPEGGEAGAGHGIRRETGARGGMSPEARERLQALRAAGPQQGPVIEKIWGVLNEAQRARLESRFEKLRAEEMRRREQRKLEERDGNGASRKRGGARVDPETPESGRKRVTGGRPDERRAARARDAASDAERDDD